MYIWEGKIKGYNTQGEFIGTFRAIIRKDGEILFRMNLYFDSTHKRYKNPMTNEEFVSSNLEVLKRKFRTSIPVKDKAKIIWRKKKEC